MRGKWNKKGLWGMLLLYIWIVVPANVFPVCCMTWFPIAPRMSMCRMLVHLFTGNLAHNSMHLTVESARPCCADPDGHTS